uniref:class I SAM-dependent methyltransferase n=1 Tax=Methanoculleus chikugoensis TaxID=118126 RepID=UPI001FB42F52
DAQHLPFRDEAFDAVFLVHVAGHLPPAQGRKAVASEAVRVLRPGGTLFFRSFSVEDMRAGKGGTETEPWTFRRGGEGIITHYFTEAETAELFAPLVAVSVRTHRWRMRVRGGRTSPGPRWRRCFAGRGGREGSALRRPDPGLKGTYT